ncbi:unnamed protein product [Hermetia illucens]|uniref:Uncharacterized protein n=1 Tax=Hermetia illucens TaxID=343691 RepID=A0A7R8YL85_HERIL|nr:unnamed protein product [Hermetia illucens]
MNERVDHISIEGIGEDSPYSQNQVNMLLGSRINGLTTCLNAHVLLHILSSQLTQHIRIESWPTPQNLPFADLNFNKLGKINMLIKADLHYNVLAIGQFKLGDNVPPLQKTVSDWMLLAEHTDRRQKNIQGQSGPGKRAPQ